MQKQRWIGPVPTLVLAAGVVSSTVVVMLARDSTWGLIAGPALMALALVGASILARRLGRTSSETMRVAALLGGAVVLASVIVALRDPSRIPAIMPILGGGAAVTVALNLGKTGHHERNAPRGV